MRKTLLILVVFCLMTALGCNKDNQSETAADASADTTKKAPKLATLNIDTSNMDCEKIDINNDGKVDQKVYTKNGIMQFVVRDFNFDGVTDLTEFYKDGVHYRDEIDLDFDGVCDLIVSYRNGNPYKKEFSNDFEGNRHGILYLDEKGNVIEIHRDLNLDGEEDVIEYYRPGEEEAYKVDRIAPPEPEKTEETAQDNTEAAQDNTEAAQDNDEASQDNAE